MSMRFRYRPYQLRKPAWTLGGQMDRPRPIVDVSITGPLGAAPQRCVLDTAADDSVFPEAIAHRVGIDLTGAPAGEGGAVGGAVIPVRFAIVTLRLSAGRENREWPARVAFTAVKLARALLGFVGCLQFFGAFFDGEQEEVELTVNGLYPGT